MLEDCQCQPMEHLREVGRYTVAITRPRDMLDKLWFNIEVFEWALSSRDGGTRQAYAILDYAQASCAMHDWICKALNPNGSPEVFWALLDEVPWARALRDIANSSKHARVDEKYWPGGSHEITFRADEDARDALEADLDNLDLNFSGFLSSIIEGQAWGEGLLRDAKHPDGVLVREALLQNHAGWTDALHRHGLS